MLQLNDLALQPDQKIIRADEYQAYLDGEAIIQRAKDQAAEIVTDAQGEYERQKLQGYQDGLTEGKLEMAEKMVDSVGRTVDYFAGLEKRIVELVVKATRKIIGDLDDETRVVNVVRNALSMTRTEAKVAVRINPGDAEIVQQKLDDITRPYPGIHFLEVVPDSRLEPGACILETDMGVVDATINVQLQAIEQSLSRSMGTVSD